MCTFYRICAHRPGCFIFVIPDLIRDPVTLRVIMRSHWVSPPARNCPSTLGGLTPSVPRPCRAEYPRQLLPKLSKNMYDYGVVYWVNAELVQMNRFTSWSSVSIIKRRKLSIERSSVLQTLVNTKRMECFFSKQEFMFPIPLDVHI
jgi:hypothetical protein